MDRSSTATGRLGTLLEDSDTVEMIQTFYSAEGATWRSGHREKRSADGRVAESSSIDQERNGNPQRVYVWLKQE